MRFVPSLSIERAQGALRYRLDIPERHLHEPILEEFRQPLDDATLQNLLQSAEALLRSPESPSFAQEAQARGQVLYRTLIPPRLREKLREISGSPLLISTSLYGMPWELLHDEQEFWGLRYALGKRLVLDRPMAGGGPAPRMRPRPRVLVIGSDPRGDLPFVRREVDEICDTLEGAADIVCVVDRLATFETVSGYLGEGFDLIHYSGHIVSTPETGPALLLAQDRPLTASVIEANVAGRPLVFLNACASVREGQAPAVGEWEATVSSVANAFLFGGAVAVVGTVADVSDQHASRLAERFYRGVLDAKPVGEALRAARVECRDDPAIGGSPTWLSFVLYGNPGQTLLRRGAVVPLPGLPAATPEPGAPVTAPEVVPAPVSFPHAGSSRRWFLSSLGILAVLAVLAGLLAWRGGKITPALPDPFIIGVMSVKTSPPGDVPSWMPDLTRDSLNTILGTFPPIKVFSRQKIEFVRDKSNLPDTESGDLQAAEELGMHRMLNAFIVAKDGEISIRLDILDVQTGLLAAPTVWVSGKPEDMMELQNELAVRALHALGISPPPEKIEAVRASRKETSLDAYKMFSEAFGGGHASDHPQAPGQKPPHDNRSAPATKDRSSWFSFASVAWAAPDAQEEAAIRNLFARYAAILNQGDLTQLPSLYPTLSEQKRQGLERFFSQVHDFHVSLSNLDIADPVMRDGAKEVIVEFDRVDRFVDNVSGRFNNYKARRSARVRQLDNGAWVIAELGT